jgi:CubicO group peptidase (beta-lactamase class C family)
MNRGLRIVVLLVIWLFIPGTVLSQDDTAHFAPARNRLQQFIDAGDLAGVVVSVGNAQGLLYLDALGKQSLETNAPMQKDSLFRIASMTKPITAIGIMMLVDEGKLSVDDPVEKHLPEFQGQQLVASREKDTVTLKKPTRPITVRDLLTHTAGLPGYPPGFAQVYTKRHRTLAETTLAISQRPLEFEPGSRWSYCNPGIDTLGRIIEVLSGQSFEEFMQRRLFGPLGMKDTTFYPTASQLERLAVTYDKKDGKLVPSNRLIIDITKDARHPVPAGGLFSTAEDLARLYQVMLNRGVQNNTRFWSDASHDAMTRIQTGELKTGFVEGMSFGFGWAVVKEPKGVTRMLSPGTYGHGGAFGTQAWIDPKQGLYFVLLIQRTGLPNADASPFRDEFQRLAVEAVNKR